MLAESFSNPTNSSNGAKSKPAKKAVYAHLDFAELNQILQTNKGLFKRVCVVTDGVFSMRGDFASLDQISALCKQHESGYEEGIITLVDDSHGVGAFGDCMASLNKLNMIGAIHEVAHRGVPFLGKNTLTIPALNFPSLLHLPAA